MSGSVCPERQDVLVPHVAQPVANPPPGFCHFEGLPVRTVRVLQNHWPPPPAKFRLATTETHFVPALRMHPPGIAIVNDPTGASTKVSAGKSQIVAPGTPAASAKNVTRM